MLQCIFGLKIDLLHALQVRTVAKTQQQPEHSILLAMGRNKSDFQLSGENSAYATMAPVVSPR